MSKTFEDVVGEAAFYISPTLAGSYTGFVIPLPLAQSLVDRICLLSSFAGLSTLTDYRWTEKQPEEILAIIADIKRLSTTP